MSLEIYYKYVNILPFDNNKNITIPENSKVIANSKYSKIGITKLGISLLSSDCDINNYTVLPGEFENQYLYTYILSLYLKLYIKKLNYEFKEGKNLEKIRKEFVKFTKNIWIQEVTSEDIGSLYYNYTKEALEIEKIYNEVKNKYNILYSELKIEKSEKTTKIMIGILIASLIFNIINFVLYFK